MILPQDLDNFFLFASSEHQMGSSLVQCTKGRPEMDDGPGRK
jgi:hypothetical protein